jgi:hypothetical protein
MIAIVHYFKTTYGCQKEKEKLIDWTSGGEDSQVVEFNNTLSLSPKVNAIKHLRSPYQFGNSFTVYNRFVVELLPL